MAESASFLPEDEFVAANQQPIEAIFEQLGQDFPESTITFEGASLTPAEALKIDDEGQLTPQARQWLWQRAQGFQHGYDRGVGSKIYTPHHDPTYMGLLNKLNYGDYNFVSGGEYAGDNSGKNILVPCGFPHINASRLRVGVASNYETLWDAAHVVMISGQRRRWNDNIHEATGAIVLSETLLASGLSNSDDQEQVLKTLQDKSRFVKEQSAKPETDDWAKQYPTEAEIARLALETALVQTGGLFDWREYPVTEWVDETAEPIIYGNHVFPARNVRAWQYHLNNSRSAWVINAKALPRTAPDGAASEPRPNGESAALEAYHMVGEALHDRESIITTGAPHIRLGVDTATSLLKSSGDTIGKLHLAAAPWEHHEPPVTGIASIVSTQKADKRLRAAIAGKDPDSPELLALGQ